MTNRADSIPRFAGNKTAGPSPGQNNQGSGKGSEVNVKSRVTPIFAVFTFFGGMFGCVAYEHVRHGDGARLADRPRVALDHYLLAVEADPRLGQDETFVANLRGTRARVAYVDGKAFYEQHAWDQAIECLRRALQLDPANDQARRVLESTLEGKRKRQGEAKRRHDQATALQGQYKWRQSLQPLRRVLEILPEHLHARAALHKTDEMLGKSESARHAAAMLLQQKRLVLRHS